MFTEYHLEKIIQAINDAEERQTQAIVAAIEKLKPEPVKVTQERHGVELSINPDLFTPEEEEALAKAIDESRVVPVKKPSTAPKKPIATKKPAPVRERN